MVKIHANVLKIITRISEKSIAPKIQSAEKFDSSFISNDKEKIIFGLTSLLASHSNQYQAKKSRKRGGLVTFSAITLAGGVILCYAKYDSDLRNVLKKYIPFVDPVIKTIFLEKEEKPLPAIYGIKSTIVGYIYGKKSKTNNPDVSEGLSNYIPSFGSIKRGTGYILSTTYNGIKKPITSLFYTNTVPDGAENKANSWSTTKVLRYLANELEKIGNLLRNIHSSVSRERMNLLYMWLQEINNIYYAMKTLNTPTSSIILSQYSKYSKTLNKLIWGISKEEDYSRVIAILAFATAISIQLFLIAYFNVPFTDQLANIAFAVYDNATLLMNDAQLRETLKDNLNKVQAYVPININMLLSLDWLYYINVMNMTNSVFRSVTNYGK